VNVAVAFFAAFVPFEENVTVAGPVADQAYVRLGSPPSSAPSTDRLVVVPVTGFGLAEAAVATVGGASVTVAVTAPLMLPSAARTVYAPGVVGAV
jgi:hypothetical protein